MRGEIALTALDVAGGDGFTNLRVGTDRATATGFDIDALTAYLGAQAPIPPGPANRITLVS